MKRRTLIGGLLSSMAALFVFPKAKASCETLGYHDWDSDLGCCRNCDYTWKPFTGEWEDQYWQDAQLVPQGKAGEWFEWDTATGSDTSMIILYDPETGKITDWIDLRHEYDGQIILHD